MRFQTVLIVLSSVLIVAALMAAPPESAKSHTPGDALSTDYNTFIDANRILMFVTNRGSWGRDLSGFFGYDYGTWWPFAGDTSAIRSNIGGAGNFSPQYAAGLWMGGMVGDQLRVAVAEYSTEYVPGPMSGGTYLPDDPTFRVYKLYRDSLESNPNDDYLNWPADQGAPVDAQGKPIMFGDQMLWSVFNDANPSAHIANPGRTAPLGIEVQNKTYAFDQLGALGDVVFSSFKLCNMGGNTISNFYISIWSDIEIGGAGDDFVGCDTLADIFFGYNADNYDAQYLANPPAAGFKVIAGPVVPSFGDSAYFDGTWIPDHKNMNMTAFVKYINGTDPDNYYEAYGYMKGLTKTGAPYVYDGQILTYHLSGDPVTGVGDLDILPADRRMMASFGPIDLNPGDSQFVLVAFGCARGADNIASVAALKNLLGQATDYPTLPEEDFPPREQKRLRIGQNFPNPFNLSTTIEYSVPISAKVTIDIYNILGQRVRCLVNEVQTAGDKAAEWDGTTDLGGVVSSGIYFYRVQIGEETDNRTMILLK